MSLIGIRFVTFKIYAIVLVHYFYCSKEFFIWTAKFSLHNTWSYHHRGS